MPLQRPTAVKRAAAAAPAAAAPLTSPTAAAAGPSSTAAPSITSPSKSKPAAGKPAQPSSSSSPSASTSTSAASPSSSSSPIAPQVKVVKAPKEGYAMVKAVTSGDTLIVWGNITQAGQLLPEKTIIVSGITTPKFAKGKNQTDEPFAWEAREYLRKKVIGQKRSAHSITRSTHTPTSAVPSPGRLTAIDSVCLQSVPQFHLTTQRAVYKAQRATSWARRLRTSRSRSVRLPLSAPPSR